ncbi:MAG: Tim44/TimA family putative adaptor protein [Alphaproteobacteria bacterium]|nr:Tim44/TimA family putative adaptor protein [Alphaproteobacteria bacterium]MBU6471402.1 Tim44/TimA family putative adaptor protein [Alphaproteobacteria bacterium]MDE2012273.1 Tim44 domain-containing protein [Alphaproteobacteria bacterium]MDE2072840.1 Tim44 domain-containing protein [Alphaproteobacteria bacterium]MDE2351732.1 Tim44 domain-containing protein [Alphaproteobacteria bacterium]
MLSSQLLFIVLIATVAGVILFRLYTVLGRRTGHERPPREPYGLARSNDNVVALPDRSARAEALDQPADPVARGLMEIKLADRNFDDGHFLAGAKGAYEILVKAFAAGDRATLRPLLSDEVYAAFDGVIRERAAKREKVDFTFVGFREAKIVHAALKRRTAELTVNFTAQYISATTDASGAVIEGDAKLVRTVNDVWTFNRDVKASDPNWTVVATHGDDA